MFDKPDENRPPYTTEHPPIAFLSMLWNASESLALSDPTKKHWHQCSLKDKISVLDLVSQIFPFKFTWEQSIAKGLPNLTENGRLFITQYLKDFDIDISSLWDPLAEDGKTEEEKKTSSCR